MTVLRSQGMKDAQLMNAFWVTAVSKAIVVGKHEFQGFICLKIFNVMLGHP